MDLAAELQKIYDSEINVEISWLWDGGIEVRLGDHLNGFVAETNVFLGADILPWLQEAIAHFYPDSTYCSLDQHRVIARTGSISEHWSQSACGRG